MLTELLAAGLAVTGAWLIYLGLWLVLRERVPIAWRVHVRRLLVGAGIVVAVAVPLILATPARTRLEVVLGLALVLWLAVLGLSITRWARIGRRVRSDRQKR